MTQEGANDVQGTEVESCKKSLVTLLGNPKDKLTDYEKWEINEVKGKDSDQTRKSFGTFFEKLSAHLKYEKTEQQFLHIWQNNHRWMMIEYSFHS